MLYFRSLWIWMTSNALFKPASKSRFKMPWHWNANSNSSYSKATTQPKGSMRTFKKEPPNFKASNSRSNHVHQQKCITTLKTVHQR